jgi:hypothetical protein
MVRPGERYLVELVPGVGAVLPPPLPALLMGMSGPEVRELLRRVAEEAGSEEPAGGGFVCGLADPRQVRIGDGFLGTGLALGSTVRTLDWIWVALPRMWPGGVELRVRLEGVDVLHEPAGDVLWMLGGLGYAVRQDRRGWVKCTAPDGGEVQLEQQDAPRELLPEQPFAEARLLSVEYVRQRRESRR